MENCDYLVYKSRSFPDRELQNQKNNVPPHLERRGLIGTCFLDAQDCIHPCTEVHGFLHQQS